MEQKEFTVLLQKELCEYLERLHFLVNSETNIIKHMIESTDSVSLEHNPSWEYFYNKYTNDYIEYEMVKEKVTEELRRQVEEKTNTPGISFNWEIKDFRTCLVIIKL